MMLENTQISIQTEELRQLREVTFPLPTLPPLTSHVQASGIEGGGSKCQKCASMQVALPCLGFPVMTITTQDELTRNLREKADDKQQILKMTQQVARKKLLAMSREDEVGHERDGECEVLPLIAAILTVHKDHPNNARRAEVCGGERGVVCNGDR
eukprot:768415-Hanusia_phi.AAC.2